MRQCHLTAPSQSPKMCPKRVQMLILYTQMFATKQRFFSEYILIKLFITSSSHSRVIFVSNMYLTFQLSLWNHISYKWKINHMLYVHNVNFPLICVKQQVTWNFSLLRKPDNVKLIARIDNSTCQWRSLSTTYFRSFGAAMIKWCLNYNRPTL